jgi:hypothetical protein
MDGQARVTYPAAASVHHHADLDLWASNRRTGQLLLITTVFLGLSSGYYFSLAILPAALGVGAPTARLGLLPEWVGTREILFHRRSPYRSEVTKEIQTGVYGDKGVPHANQERFAYPVYFALLFAPLGLMPFAAARVVGLAGCLAATLLSVRLWMTSLGLARPSTIVVTAATFAVYPVILGLQLCQPTLLIAGLLAVVVWLAISGRLAWAGTLAGLCTAKPQLAIAVLLPLCIWSVAGWHERKRFLLSLLATVAGLLSGSELIVPGWIGPWLETLRAYSRYAGSAPILREMAGGRLFLPACALLMSAIIWVGVRFCDSDLLFAISFSIAAFQLIFPFLIYNEVLLLPAALWLLKYAGHIRTRSQWHKLLWSLSWIALSAGVATAAGLSLLNLLVPGAALKLWELPLLAAWIYPGTILLALACCAVPDKSRSLALSRVA